MSIKKVIATSIVVSAVFLLASCYRMAIQPTGNITLHFAGTNGLASIYLSPISEG